MESQDEIEFFRRIPKVISSDARFIIEGIGSSLFSIEASYRRLIETLRKYNQETIFQIDLFDRANVFSDAWSIIDNCYAVFKLLMEFQNKNSQQRSSGAVHDEKIAFSNTELWNAVDRYTNEYEESVAGLRNMMDHLHQNIKRVSSSASSPPIQGSLSYHLISKEDYLHGKSYIVMLTNNTLTQDSCSLNLPNPAGKTIVSPIDHVTLCALDTRMEASVCDISGLVEASIILRRKFNQTLEEKITSKIREVSIRRQLSFEELMQPSANGITVTMELGFEREAMIPILS